MDLERLPSGKFDTNSLILELAMIACNILRMIRQETIGGRTPRHKRDVKFHRLRTVISNLIMMASHVTTNARQVIMGLGKSNVWRHVFAEIFHRFNTSLLPQTGYKKYEFHGFRDFYLLHVS